MKLWNIAYNVAYVLFWDVVVAIEQLHVHFRKLSNHSCRWFLQMCHSRKNHNKKQMEMMRKRGKCHVALT